MYRFRTYSTDHRMYAYALCLEQRTNKSAMIATNTREPKQPAIILPVEYDSSDEFIGWGVNGLRDTLICIMSVFSDIV